MRVRSVVTVFAMSGLLAAAVARCALPPVSSGPQAYATTERLVRGALLSLPDSPVDRAALVASLRELDVKTVILQSAATSSGARIDERVALAVELQRELDADVFIGTYQSSGLSGKPMDALLQKDSSFTACYPTDGPRLDADTLLIDKLRLCSQDVSNKLAAALQAANASTRIGCYITHAPELAANLTDEGRAKLNELLRDGAGACSAAGRVVAVSPLLSLGSGDPATAGLAFRESLRDSGIGRVILQDGIGTSDAGSPRRAASYYQGLRNALADREAPYGPVTIWAGVEAFECETPTCVKTHPVTLARFTEQLCGARQRVDGIVAVDYLHDLAERPLFTSTLDASADLQAILDDSDAAAQLRQGYLAWREAGASCAVK
jgi:hypothetical protein